MNLHTDVGRFGILSVPDRRVILRDEEDGCPPRERKNWMSDCRTFQATDMLLTQEWTLTGANASGQLASTGSCFRALVLTGTCRSQGEIIYIYMVGVLYLYIYTNREATHTSLLCE